MSAQRELLPLNDAATEADAAAPFALKEQVAARLAAHRARRAQPAAKAVTPIAPATPVKARAARIAAAVAERYANSKSYREFLAAEAEEAIRRAEAAADVAALNARAVADAQYQLLDELDQWALTPDAEAPATVAVQDASLVDSRAVDARSAQGSSQEIETPVGVQGLTVRLYEEGIGGAAEYAGVARSRVEERGVEFEGPTDEAEGRALDEEILFRHSPVFEEAPGAPIDIPANLIEFPRQLVAARKARPRLAEGPLREDIDASHLSPEAAQLRIFEVEPVQISTTPAVESMEPEWSSILLAAHPVSAPVESTEPQFSPLLAPQPAALSLRLMAGIVDGCILAASLLLFGAAFAFAVGRTSGAAAAGHAGLMTPQTAAISAGLAFCVLAALYHLLFFTFSDATPGMRYARIGLCTFSDENPSRSAMRRRLFAMVLSACPLGIGFLWACLDEDGLGWHDRISRMYQRSY